MSPCEWDLPAWTSDYPTTMNIPRVDGLSTGPPGWGVTTDSSTKAKKRFERWDRSNRMSLMTIKCGIPETFKGIISGEFTTAKEFLDDIEKRFVKNN